MKREADSTIIEQLKKQILNLQDRRPLTDQKHSLGFGQIEEAFPGRIFPRGAVHEFISTSSEEATSTSGFLSVILNRLMHSPGFCLWISARPRRMVFPPALSAFGVEPERILFVDTATAKETLWALEEALKCGALTAVVGELSELSFNDSRRLQLAVERSHVTGLIHRFRPRTENVVACVTRWKIKPIASSSIAGMPGPGFPCWNVDLLKVRNGKPGQWQVKWSRKGLEYLKPEIVVSPQTLEREAG
jgi:protein ImuA